MKRIARAVEASYGMHGSKACCSKIGCAAWNPAELVTKRIEVTGTRDFIKKIEAEVGTKQFEVVHKCMEGPIYEKNIKRAQSCVEDVFLKGRKRLIE